MALKSEAQLDGQALHRVRDRLVRRSTAKQNRRDAQRRHLAARGIVSCEFELLTSVTISGVNRSSPELLEGVIWEAIFVDDDSADGTADLVSEIAQHNQRIRVIRRIRRRGLASACVEGVLSSSAPHLG